MTLAMRTALLSALLSLSAVHAAEETAALGKPAPVFRLPPYNPDSVGGAAMVGLDKFVGPDATDKGTKVVLLSFMASFCAPCKKEMPYLQALHERYASQGLRVIMVSIDTEPEGQKKIDELIAANKVTFPVLKDRFNLVARRWLGAQSPLPSVFLVKPDGTLSMVHRGYGDDASALLSSAVGEAIGTRVEVQVASAAEPVPAVAAANGKDASSAKAGGKGRKGKRAAPSPAAATASAKP